MWDSRDRYQHYTKKDWPARDEMVPRRSNNIVNNPLVVKHKILFPPLHIKLGLIKQFTKALDKDGGCFSYLCHVFPGLSIRNWKVASLMVLKFVASSEVLSLRSQWPNWNRKHWKPLFWLWKKFWATAKPVIMKNLSPTCFMLSKTLNATWA